MPACENILVIALSGIGNTLLLTPLLAALQQQAPHAQVDLLVGTQGMAEVVAGGGLVNECLVLPQHMYEALAFIPRLRGRKYGTAIVAFPSNKWQFHALAWLIGARQRVAHRYMTRPWRTLAFLENRGVGVVDGLHDVDQNLNLLHALDLDPSRAERRIHFHLAGEDQQFAACWLAQHGLQGRILIGLHPGAGGFRKGWQGLAKRWPALCFAALGDRLIEEQDASILLVGGSEEAAVKAQVRKASRHPDRINLFNGSLKQTAAILSHARLMVSNDSALMHLAAAVGVPTLGIFGPTNPTRTAPCGAACRIVRQNLPCQPCLKYPFQTSSSRIHCTRNTECLRSLTVEQVYQAAAAMLAESSNGKPG